MSNKHLTTVSKIFAHPIDMNIAWRDVIHMFEALGGELDHTRHGQLKVKLNGREKSFGIPHHEHTIKSRDEIVAIRHFLEAAGFAPATS
ncbi:MAG: hypothetical protein JNL80_13780 [Phycisphaerae bacterium]|jgi:hypothetical protein|nr:hypothetical protein [Phycisphaerae bacterium]